MVDTSLIRENMEVYSSDGEMVGHVSATGPGGLSVRGSGASGPGRDVPLDWISRVDDHVHLHHSAPVVRARLSGIPEPPPHRTEGSLTGPWIIGGILLLIALVLLVLAISGYW